MSSRQLLFLLVVNQLKSHAVSKNATNADILLAHKHMMTHASFRLFIDISSLFEIVFYSDSDLVRQI